MLQKEYGFVAGLERRGVDATRMPAHRETEAQKAPHLCMAPSVAMCEEGTAPALGVNGEFGTRELTSREEVAHSAPCEAEA